VWTLAEASVECRVMSGATAAAADETGCAEQRDGARRKPKEIYKLVASTASGHKTSKTDQSCRAWGWDGEGEDVAVLVAIQCRLQG
jgi:hypothetical protein